MTKENKAINGNKILAKYDEKLILVENGHLLLSEGGRGYWGVLYDKDWVQLMSIIDKIERDGFRFFLESNEDHIRVRFTDMAIPGREIVSVKHIGVKITAVWIACVEVVKYINSNGNNNV